MQIHFIGAGNMAEALMRGLQGMDDRPVIRVENRSREERLRFLAGAYGVEPAAAGGEIAPETELVVLAVKPKDVEAALAGRRLPPAACLVSVAAGVPIGRLQQIGRHLRVARAMPNTPSAVGVGMTALAYSAEVPPAQRSDVERLFAAVGETALVAESDLDAVTAVSGSGPAYFFYLAEAMIEAALGEGLDERTASLLVRQTFRGAAALWQDDPGTSPRTFRERVTSPGGTTEAALLSLESAGARDLIRSAVHQARLRSEHLSPA